MDPIRLIAMCINLIASVTSESLCRECLCQVSVPIWIFQSGYCRSMQAAGYIVCPVNNVCLLSQMHYEIHDSIGNSCLSQVSRIIDVFCVV